MGTAFKDTFQYTIKMSNGTLSVGTLTVLITNTNDGPVVTASDLDGNVYEDAGVVTDDPNTVAIETGSFLTDTGTIKFDDADTLDTHTVTVTADAGNQGTLKAEITDTAAVGDGTVTWTYSIDNALTQHLGAGDAAEEKFTVKISDNHGAWVEKEVVITLHGENDAASITNLDDPAPDFSVTEDADLSAGGTLLVLDLDDGESFFDTSYTGGAGAYGTFTFDAATGVWTYALNNADPAVQALNAGGTLTDTYLVKSVDGTPHTITVTINGADEPVVPTPVTSPTQTYNVNFNFVSPQNGATDHQLTLPGVDGAFNFSGTVDLTVVSDINKSNEKVFITMEGGTQQEFTQGISGSGDPIEPPNTVTVNNSPDAAFLSSDNLLDLTYHTSNQVGGTTTVSGTVTYTYEYLI